MIQIITGKLGAGKTLFTVQLMFEKLCEGRTCITNIDVKWDEMKRAARRLKRIHLRDDQLIRIDLQKEKNWHQTIPFGTRDNFLEVFLDEIHLVYNSRDWSDTTKNCKGLLSFLTQSRKACVNVTFIAQEESTMDKQFRIQAEWLLYIVNSSYMPLGFLGNLPISFYIVCKRDPQNGNLLSRSYKSYDKRFFAVYESYAFLDDEMAGLAANAQRIERIKLRRVSIFAWIWEPVATLFRIVSRFVLYCIR